MDCLEKYRRGLVRQANRRLRDILDSADEAAVHDFRVAVKRLTALYHFVQQVDEQLPVQRWLQPCRGLFKRGGRIRDAQIAIGLIGEFGELPRTASRPLLAPLQAAVRHDYRRFQQYAHERRLTAVRLPRIATTGISQAAIRRQRPACFEQLRARIVSAAPDIGDDEWHRIRILLKRYHHLLDAFTACPGYSAPATQLKQITQLEQLLGDWHDRVTTIELLHSRFDDAALPEALISRLEQQRNALLVSSSIYLDKLAKTWTEAGPAA